MAHVPTDSDLLAEIACKSDDAARADAALEELLARHGQYVYDWLRQVYSKSMGREDIDDVYAMTVARVWERAETYDDRKESVRPWLCTIARNLAADFFRTRNSEEITADSDIWATLAAKSHVDVKSGTDPVIIAVTDGLAALSDREQEILLATAHTYNSCVAAKDQRMPREVLAKIADRWKTTPTNIRKVRERALEKLKTYLLGKGISANTIKALRGGRDV